MASTGITTISELSDAELDAVGGGFDLDININIAVVTQVAVVPQVNVAVGILSDVEQSTQADVLQAATISASHSE